MSNSPELSACFYTLVVCCQEDGKMATLGLHSNPEAIAPDLEVGQVVEVPGACRVHDQRHASSVVLVPVSQPNWEHDKFLDSYKEIQKEAFQKAEVLFKAAEPQKVA